MKSLDCPFGIEPPVCRPYSQDVPTKSTQHLIADFIAVSRGGRTMIRRAVTFDPREIQTGLVRVADSEIYAVARHADLGDNLPSTLFQMCGHSLLEWRFHLPLRAGVLRRKRNRTAHRIIEKCLEMADTCRSSAIEINVVSTDACEDLQFAARASHGDVETSFAAVSVYCAERHGQLAGGVAAEGDLEVN